MVAWWVVGISSPSGVLDVGVLMILDTRKIDQRIQKLKQLKEILADPETAELAREVLISANGTESIAGRQGPEIRRFPRTRRAKRSRKGDLIKAVLEEAQRLQGESFTKSSILQALHDRGFAFATEKPQVAVGQTLRKLTDKHHKIKLVKEGQGREPNVYSN